jgi:hypothetical protein
MRGTRLISAVLVCGLLAVALAAAFDAMRSDGANADEPTPTATPDPLAAQLAEEEIGGVLYYSATEDDCRVRAVRLPAGEPAEPPILRACRFELAAEPGTGVVRGDFTWRRDGSLGAACRNGRVSLSGPSGAHVRQVDGCAPAWKPGGGLTVVRDGEVWGLRMPCAEACARRLLTAGDIKKAARYVLFVPDAPRFLHSTTVRDVAWLDENRAAVIVRVRLRGRLRAIGPAAVLAVYEGGRLIAGVQYAGASDLRLSPTGRFLGVVESGGRLAVVDQLGRQLLNSSDLPVPSAHAIAWSPDERWTAIATEQSVYLIPTVDIAAERVPRLIRLPLAARDLAWR